MRPTHETPVLLETTFEDCADRSYFAYCGVIAIQESYQSIFEKLTELCGASRVNNALGSHLVCFDWLDGRVTILPKDAATVTGGNAKRYRGVFAIDGEHTLLSMLFKDFSDYEALEAALGMVLTLSDKPIFALIA